MLSKPQSNLNTTVGFDMKMTLGRLQKKKYDKLGLLAEAWGGRGQVGAGGPNLLSVFLFIGVILSRGLET